jgi:hypothetical protein
MQEMQERKGDMARFGPRAAGLSPGMALDKMRIADSTSAMGMGVTEALTILA